MKRLTLDNAELLAAKMRADNGMGSSEPINAKTLIRNLGIMAIYRPLSEELWGLSLKTDDGHPHFMLINSNATRGSQHFTIAHELFHLYFEENPQPHFCGREMWKDPAERSANMFASALLMPREGLLANIPMPELQSNQISISTILRLEQLYGVSHRTFVVRLKELKIITPDYAEQLNALSIKHEAAMRGYDPSIYEPGNEGLIIGDFGDKARQLFDQERISEGHYNELMNMIGYGKSEMHGIYR